MAIFQWLHEHQETEANAPRYTLSWQTSDHWIQMCLASLAYRHGRVILKLSLDVCMWSRILAAANDGCFRLQNAVWRCLSDVDGDVEVDEWSSKVA